jgi:muramidase (phage lysozyme)
MSLELFQRALENTNVLAFLQVIRYGEGTSDSDGYRRCFGGELFDSFQDHPRRKITARLGQTTITSTAAGAYQFLSKTWDGLVQRWGFRDFSPRNQDLGAVALIQGRKALEDVIAGRFEEAVLKCAKEWASLPGSPYGQPTIKVAKAHRVYTEAGGQYVPVIVEPPPSWSFDEAPEGKPNMVAPLIGVIASAILPTLAAKIPEIFELSRKESSVERNVDLAVKVLEIAKAATGAKSAEDVVAVLDTPAGVASIREAVKAEWFTLAEVGGGGIAGARAANAQYGGGSESPKFWLQPAFAIAVAVLPLVYFTVYIVLTGAFSDETKVMVVTAVVTGALGSVLGFFLGSSHGSQNKDRALIKAGGG